MLKVDSIKFTDSKNRTYYIFGNQIESFPVIGGEESNMITTHVWNQQGNTHINSLIEPYEGELLFILYTRNMRLDEIEASRRNLTNICNPLNGTVKMTITLNNGSAYNRDIVFNTAPHFPVGLENRNRDWQKVQLLYTANNPFWYEESEIVESFQASVPSFKLPFTMSTTNPVIFGNITPTQAAVNNGQAEAPLTIEIAGACINPKITNETTGEFIAFKNLTMAAGQKLIINTAFGEKKVQLDGANVFHKLDFNSTFFNLAIGENKILFTDDLGNPDASIIFRYKNLYVTI